MPDPRTQRKTYARKPICTASWYEPHDRQEAIDQAVWFRLSHPRVTATDSSGDARLPARVLHSMSRFRALEFTEQEALITATDPTWAVFA
jgi:hypothetical protein